jgi:hypothetical protein
VSQALLKPHARDYVRRTQERLILTPVLELLIAVYGSSHAAEKRLIELVEQQRQRERTAHGYAPGNLANLLRVLRGNLRGIDLSALRIRQAFFQDTEMQDASLSAADICRLRPRRRVQLASVRGTQR